MASSSLFEVTRSVRRYLIYFVIFVVVVLLIQFCGGLAQNLLKGRNTTAQIYKLPDYRFGEIKLINMSNLAISPKSQPTFSVDNVLPNPGHRSVNVYRIEEPRERFGIEDVAKDVAKRFGFTANFARDEAANKLVWVQAGKRLEFDKVKVSWSYTNSGVKLPGRYGVFNSAPIEYRKQVGELAGRLGIPENVFNYNTTEVDYLIRKGSSYVEASSANTAEYIKLRVYRQFESVSLAPGQSATATQKPQVSKVYKDDYFSAPLEIILTSNNEKNLNIDLIVKVSFTNWLFSKEVGSYDLLTPAEAWENIKAGKGALKELTEFGFNRYEVGRLPNQEVLAFTANYQQVNLAYLEPDTWSGYIYPIYIFKGRAKLANSPDQPNADFVFYTNALKDKPASTPTK